MARTPAPPAAALTPPKFKIENGVPMPRPSKLATGYPFDDMMPTQCFFVPVTDPDDRRRVSSQVATAGRAYSKRHGDGKLRYVCKVVDGGVRCWRWQ